MDASDLVDFLLKDDDIPLTVCYEVPQMPWQTTKPAKRDHSKGRSVRSKQCSDFSLAEMTELLEDLEQLITRPPKDQDVEVTVKGRNWGEGQRCSANNESAVKKSGKKARSKSKKQQPHIHDDSNMKVEQRQRQLENKTKISDGDRSKKKSKKNRNKAKTPEFDACGEEADPVEIRAIIKSQHIAKKEYRDHNMSQIRDLQRIHHTENGTDKQDREPERSKKKKQKTELEVGIPASDQSLEVRPISTKKTRKKKKKKEPEEKQCRNDSSNGRAIERKNESNNESRTLDDIKKASKTGKKETKNERNRYAKGTDHYLKEEAENKSKGNSTKPKSKPKRSEAAENDF